MNEEKTKVDGKKWTTLRDWMAHEGTKRGRCGVRPSDAEVTRVYEELGAGTVGELADYAAHKIHFMRRYNWLLPFARTVAKRAAVHGNGNGNGQAKPKAWADFSRAERLDHVRALLLVTGPDWKDHIDYSRHSAELADLRMNHPSIVAEAEAEP